MPNFTAGTSFTDGVTNDVTAAKLNALVADAVPTSNLSLNSTTGTIGLFSSGTGTAATPAIQPTGDTNTGIFFPAADTIAFSEGGAESMRIDSSGNVGIGTSPSRKLDVNGVAGATYLMLTSNTASAPAADAAITRPADGALGLITNSTERLRIDSSGNVGIGVTSPAVKLDVSNGNIQGKEILLQNGAASSPALGTTPSWYSPASGVAALSTNATERLRIDSSGNLLVGTTSLIGNGKISVQANLGAGSNGINIDDSASSSGGVFARFSVGTGTLCGFISRNAATNAVLYNTSSDYRLKENVQPMVGALAKVSALKPCTWTWKEAGQAGEGFIAHEIQEIVPSAVSGNKDEIYQDGSPKYQGMDASYLVATLTAAIQEQQALIQALTTRITALEAA